ncbi:hypothetical protein [Jannaschia pohangensis]|uniref:Uncharacterized protein n=1 Tax=Jannaschia pohangensis TaxID=390807 RepID=A0A1I3QSM4_9RHOB|nr:hypothetical protein [Jannaschia pohangensis]SFJ36810.1 hypothetical protein SAMN04488095_2647 [Jannaschia pohangensis]
MPTNDETFNHACSGDWDPVAGPGRVFIENLDSRNVLHWALSDASGPDATLRGYSLPAASGYRSGAEGINVPAGRILWVQGTATQAVAVTAETLP